MQDLFTLCHTILRRNEVNSIVTDNQKVAVGHVFSTIQQAILKERVTSDLFFSHHHLKKNFKRFICHRDQTD